MEEVRISDWPDPPGSHAWLPAYGFQHEIVDKDDYFCSNGDNGSTHALYLETIVEETSDDLRSERSSAATWLSDSDADSVIHVRGTAGSEDSESEREWACPAKRRRRERATSPASSGSLSRSSSLAQFESLERSCAAPASPSLSPDSLESPPASPPPTRVPAPRAHLSAENLSEDSGYSERSRRPLPPSQRRQPEIAHRPPATGSVPCLASPSAERRPPRAARALSLPAELDVCAEPRRHTTHRAHFRQTFEVSDSLTVSVADLTALDYRGGPRRPRLPPPPPPPRAARLPLPPPPPPPVDVITRQPSVSPAREPSADSDSTTESERAFAREMETTAKRLDESARRALAESGDFDRGLSVLTATRLQESWGVWDDVLDELRRRMDPQSATPTPPRTPSPDPMREPAFTSTPLRAGDARVRSTPELRARATPHRETPEELRASLQLVAPPPPGSAPPVRSISAGSKGVTFSPVVAEVSWRETSTTTTESETTSSDDAADAEVIVVEGGGEEPRAPATERAADMTDAGARAPRSRIAGFLSRFANFRFSGRKEKKSRGAGANGRPSQNAVSTADAGQGPRGAAAGPQYVRIPLKEEGVSRAAAPPVPGGVAHKPPRPRPPPAPAPGVLETDVDTQRTVLHARSLLALAPPDQRTPRPHKSMEFLLDKDSAQTVQPPENELQKNSDRVLSEHELRVQRSLQKLNVPEWYKNAPAPREGFLLRKRLSDASASATRWSGLNSKTTSLGSLGGANPQPPPPQLSPHTTSFGRWSTSRLNSNQTSPCSSTRSSIRGTSPLCSPSARSSFSARQPYLGWRSQERLNNTPRTPHERLASSLLQQSASSKASEEIQSSIKEVTSAIVHYVSGLEPANGDIDRQPSPRSSQKLCWLESSFVGTKPLESPQTPLVVSEALPPPHPRPPSSLRLDHRAAPDWQDSQRSLNLGIARPSPGSTTLEDVLDSLLGLPSQPARIPTPQPSPRKSTSPYYLMGGKSPRYEQLASSGHSSSSPASRFLGTPSEGLSSATDPSPVGTGKGTVDTPGAMHEPRRSRSAQGEHPRRRSEPFAQPYVSFDRRTSLDAAALRPSEPQLTHHDSKASLASLQTENSTDEAFMKCKYPKCTSKAPLVDAKRHYKTCHNCTTMYCSRECRRAHWEKHRKVYLHSRASALCRQIIAAAKEDADCLHQISTIAHKGYLAQGRGVVKLFFTSPESAEKFTTHGYQYLSQPEYVKWTALQPNEMGVELYTEVVKLCKAYNPETRVILFVAVCIISEVPTKGAVKWERQMVSRCAKLRLSKTVTAAIHEQNRRRHRRDSKGTPEDRETLILISKAPALQGEKNAATAHKFREICFRNISNELEKRGVTLKKHFPEVYSRLAAYVDGTSDRFIPMTIYPKDVTSGKSFMCIIMPDNDMDCVTPVDGKVVTIDVGVDRSKHQLSTPM
ncbi:nascent polypeptide-associated complex subunit alpha, muscle-specific form isoform X1 [Plodia interpunctella]|uniref:nascent polypeptide-associated complex subunit alpha, muscle-specific form isoform X1 n=1 Tax=Plodia interpunctella TaxID=58824 RepID=UPI002367C524|nr:nascent polypeptide-associated complex subunit alpha, muscle-specific form isoform X1 [Plodia interpunctella]